MLKKPRGSSSRAMMALTAALVMLPGSGCDRQSSSAGDPPRLVKLGGHCGAVNAVATSGDGKLFATAGGGEKIPYSFIHHETAIRIWNAAGEVKAVLRGHSKTVSGLAFNPDPARRQLASVSTSNRCLLVWNYQTGEETRNVPIADVPICVAFNESGTKLAVGTGKGVQVYTTDMFKLAGEITNGAPVTGVAFSGNTLVFGDTIGNVVIRSSTGDHHAVKLRDEIVGVCAHSDLMAAWTSSRVALFDQNLREVGHIEDAEITAVALGRDCLAVGTRAGAIQLYSRRGNWAPLRRGTGMRHNGKITSLAFTRDGQRLLSGSRDYAHNAALWDIQTGKPQAAPPAVPVTPESRAPDIAFAISRNLRALAAL